MEKIRIPRIRPVAWKIYVQSTEDAEYVRNVLESMNIETTDPQEEPGLTDPPLYAFTAHYSAEGPLTKEELAAILEREERIELSFDAVTPH